MLVFDSRPQDSLDAFRDDEQLVRQCLLGNQNAWSTLVRKYANLIYSMALKRRLPQEDASDVFQSVCLALLSSLPNIREPRALTAWVIQTTAHTCDKLNAQQHRWSGIELEQDRTPSSADPVDKVIDQFEREELVRQVMATQGAECQKLLDLLFLTDPPIPYEAAAAQLGLAKGSIGATRMRCLEKMRRSLEEKGFK